MGLPSESASERAALAFSGGPSGRLRDWVVTISAFVSSLAAFAAFGFFAGPAVLFVIAAMLCGLLLGRRVMLSLALVALLGIAAIGWATVHQLISAQAPDSLSAQNALPWLRTIVVLGLATGMIGSLPIDIVVRLEKSLELVRRETILREEAERARARAELVSLENKQMETIGRLAAGIAHDFNNNLAAIIGSAELLRTEMDGDASRCDLLDDVLVSSRRAAELTRQLLVYSRKAQLVLVPTNLHKLIDKTIALMRRSIDPKVSLVTRLNAESGNVLADSTLLDSALLNLLVNARDAMPNGGQITIATSSCDVADGAGQGLRPGKYVLVEVLDTGAGMDAEVLENIFEPFFTTKSVGRGTGLGLASVASTIKSFKGMIEVESELGCGSAFRIRLPCVADANSAVTHEVKQLVVGSGRVLLVDDDALVRRTAAATLKRLGYDVTVATDGLDALDIVKRTAEPFQLAVLDVQMPNLGGEATCKELRALAPTLPILIWSGYRGETDVETMLGWGAVGFIQKPYTVVGLSCAVAEAIRAFDKVK